MANHLAFDVLNRLVQRRASTAEETRAKRHLANCARCRSELEWLEQNPRAPVPSGRTSRWSIPRSI